MDVFNSFIDKIVANIVDPAIVLLGLAGFGIFVFGVLELIWGGGDQEKRSTGKQHMIWGIIGLTIMFGAYAIIQIMKSTLNAPAV